MTATQPRFETAPPSAAIPTATTAMPMTPRLRVVPQVMASPPRSVCWMPRAVRLRFVLWAVIATTLLAAGVGLWWDVSRWNALLNRGVVVSAPVYDKVRVGLRKDGYWYVGSYRFRVDGITVNDSMPITATEYHSPNRVKSVSVTYLPGSQPLLYQNGLVTATRRDDRLAQWVVGGLVAVATGGAFLLLFEYNAARERRLLRHGVAVVGRITALPPPRTNRLEYEFDAPDGTIRRGVVSLPARAYRGWSKRRSVIVLCGAAEPANHLPREAFSWVREAR